jgi:hypothetical protein
VPAHNEAREAIESPLTTIAWVMNLEPIAENVGAWFGDGNFE